MRKLVAMWVLSLVVAGVLSAIATAQVNRQTPRVVSGADLGFRVNGQDRNTGKPVGVLVIRINGEWVEVSPGVSAFPATH